MPRISRQDLDRWRGLSFTALAIELTRRLIGDEFDADLIRQLVADALDFPAPMVRLSDRSFVLELFHGPTLAFKDFGARFLARFFGRLLAERSRHATILVATSGDTGSAVAQGFHGVPNVGVVVLYPAGKVSPFQEAQMATLGGNIVALRVPGVFDDCQRLVKTAFLDARLARLNLSSANSINIGRLLPQCFYYVAAYLSATSDSTLPVVFAVPSGNLGNLTAGVIAQRLGLPVRRLVAATNVNRALPDYLDTGEYRARPSIPTISNAMDVGDPNNLPRLLALHGGSVEAMRQNIHPVSVGEEQTRLAIRQAYRLTGYVFDPHGAVAWSAVENDLSRTGGSETTIALATAHPAKFGEIIRDELGFAPRLPEAYRDWASRPLVAVDLPDTRYDTFHHFLIELAGRSRGTA